MWAAEAHDVPSVCLGGGVAANGPLRERFEEEAARLGLVSVVPPRKLCTDNGAVIAAVGDSLLSQGVGDDASLTVSASREAARARR
jgi:N6-L-threonylcarbamoyladenine synthase